MSFVRAFVSGASASLLIAISTLARAEAASDENHSALRLAVGLRAVHRDFGYKDTPADLYPNRGYPTLVPIRLPLGPAVFGEADFYPGALAMTGLAANLGLALGYEQSFATNAVFAENTPIQRTLHTQAAQFYLGARARLPFATHELGLLGAYGQQKFLLTGDEGAPIAPDVRYQFVRIVLDASFVFDDVRLGGHVGTRLVSDTGGLRTDWFPATKTSSLELGAFIGYRLSPAFDLIASLDFLRYGFDFNPIPKDTDPWTKPIAGGGHDQYVSAGLALRYHLGARAD